MRRAVTCLAVVLIAGLCLAAEPAKVQRAWASEGETYANTDSLAAVMLRSGEVRIYATSKDGHRLDIIDGATGKYLGAWGKPGTAAGELKYPNGVATVVFGPHDHPKSRRAALAVVERDNRRVQIVCPETGKSLGIFGTEHLHRPYGVSFATVDEKPLLYVTDTQVELDRTVHVFELALRGEEVTARHVRHFGEKTGPGAIQEAESVLVDVPQRRVLLCDETTRNVKVYDLDGKFSGRTFGDGLVVGDPEGLVIVEARGIRCVILTDQRKELSVWHVFDAGDYKHLGSWTGEPTIANTDGIAVFPHAFAAFPNGAFFAVDNDFEVHAYRIEDVLSAVKLEPATKEPDRRPAPSQRGE